jgi:hypothetical protein
MQALLVEVTTPNPGTAESSDGSVVYGSQCRNVIVVTSLRPRRLMAVAGEDFPETTTPILLGAEGGDGLMIARAPKA